jgi:hypothetical protein
MRTALVAISLSVCFVVTGCGKSSEHTYATKDGNVTVSNSGDVQHMTMHSTDGTATMDVNSNGGVQATMPDFAPLYPGATVTSSLVGHNTNGTTGAQVMFAVSAPPSDVIAFYKQKSAAGSGRGCDHERHDDVRGRQGQKNDTRQRDKGDQRNAGLRHLGLRQIATS